MSLQDLQIHALQENDSQIYEHFSDKQHLEIEIGAGKCKYLIQRAECNPHIGFIAIDWAGKWLKIGRERALKKDLANILFYRGHALDFLHGAVKDSSIERFHIYFPDPWPKKRHHKRRSLNASFIKLLHQKLQDDGKIEIATDYVDYYEFIQEAIAEANISWLEYNKSINERLFEPENKTNYEIKYEEEGRDLFYIHLGK